MSTALVNQVVAVTLPFAFSLMLHFSDHAAHVLASRLTNSHLPHGTSADGEIKTLCVNLAHATYIHVTYFFSTMFALVFALSNTLRINQSLFVVVAGVAYAPSVIIWFVWWSDYSLEDLKGVRGRFMRIMGIATICVLWLVTLWVELMP